MKCWAPTNEQNRRIRCLTNNSAEATFQSEGASLCALNKDLVSIFSWVTIIYILLIFCLVRTWERPLGWEFNLLGRNRYICRLENWCLSFQNKWDLQFLWLDYTWGITLIKQRFQFKKTKQRDKKWIIPKPRLVNLKTWNIMF